ncbi:hypothetical protein HK102_001783, partial [Quaeritorhiza haematococci]
HNFICILNNLDKLADYDGFGRVMRECIEAYAGKVGVAVNVEVTGMMSGILRELDGLEGVGFGRESCEQLQQWERSEDEKQPCPENELGPHICIQGTPEHWYKDASPPRSPSLPTLTSPRTSTSLSTFPIPEQILSASNPNPITQEPNVSFTPCLHNTGPTTINDLPPEIFCHILSYTLTSLSDLATIGRVCSTWRDFAISDMAISTYLIRVSNNDPLAAITLALNLLKRATMDQMFVLARVQDWMISRFFGEVSQVPDNVFTACSDAWSKNLSQSTTTRKMIIPSQSVLDYCIQLGDLIGELAQPRTRTTLFYVSSLLTYMRKDRDHLALFVRLVVSNRRPNCVVDFYDCKDAFKSVLETRCNYDLVGELVRKLGIAFTPVNLAFLECISQTFEKGGGGAGDGDCDGALLVLKMVHDFTKKARLAPNAEVLGFMVRAWMLNRVETASPDSTRHALLRPGTRLLVDKHQRPQLLLSHSHYRQSVRPAIEHRSATPHRLQTEPNQPTSRVVAQVDPRDLRGGGS